MNLDKQKVQLVNYKQEWHEAFEALKAALMKKFLNIDDIKHIGSTAISELKTKDIVDTQILILTFDDFEALQAELQAFGFNYIDNIQQDHVPFHGADYFEAGWEKRFFKGNYKGQAFNIHIRLTNSKNAQFASNFVNLLESDVNAKYAYSQFKERLANTGINKKDYCLIKDSVIDIMSLLFENNVKNRNNE